MSDFFKLDRNIQLRILMMFITVAIGSSVGPNMTIYYVEYMDALVTGFLKNICGITRTVNLFNYILIGFCSV